MIMEIQLSEENNLNQFNHQKSTQVSEEECQPIVEEKLQIVPKQKGKIVKQNRKRRVRLICVPIITKNFLRSDSEPVFIFNLQRMMKKFDEDDFQQYKYFGIQQAGIGSISSVKLDKIYNSIDFDLNLHSIGRMNFNHLIELYKSYQKQDYYDLALILEKYQHYSYNCFQRILFQLKNIDLHIPNIQETINEEFLKFELYMKEWAKENLVNDVYLLILGNLNVESRIPQLKKQILSQNLINFFSGDLVKTYEKIVHMQSYDFLTNIFRDYSQKEYNGTMEMERVKHILTESMRDNVEFEITDKITTVDGYTIPCKIKCMSLFYDHVNKKITKEYNTFFFLLTTYNFDIEQIEYLIQMRSRKSEAAEKQILQLPQIYEQSELANLDYTCQKEYFLEKFNYIIKDSSEQSI